MGDSLLRSGRRQGFTVVGNIPVKQLSLKALGLYTVMMSRPDSWEFSVSGLAAYTEVSKDTIRSLLQEMEKAGFLIRQQSHGTKGKFSSNVYVLYDEPQPLSEKTVNGETRQRENTDDGETRERENPPTENPTQSNKDLNQERLNTPPIPPTGVDEQSALFNRFWDAYPRHDGKEPARRAWRRLKPNMQLCCVMSEAIERQKRSDGWQRDGGRFIPMPATWLNQRRWEDEPAPQLKQELSQPNDGRRGRFL